MFRSYDHHQVQKYITSYVYISNILTYDSDVGFNPSTQRHYRRLPYYLYIHSYMFRSYDHQQDEKYITSYVYMSNILTYDSDAA
jgi:hypothetical protein